jgi:t-SNARE complex subunit (syntaxin)
MGIQTFRKTLKKMVKNINELGIHKKGETRGNLSKIEGRKQTVAKIEAKG